MNPANSILIACDVFQEEIEVFNKTKLPVHYLEMGLHDDPHLLRTQLQRKIDELENDPNLKNILFAYGTCGNGLKGISSRNCKLIIPKAHDCISILMGSAEKHAEFIKKHIGMYFYSPGWIRGKRVPGPDRTEGLKEIYSEKYDDEMIEELLEIDEEAFENYSCCGYLDMVQNTEAAKYTQKCATHMGWNFKRLRTDPSFLKDLLEGNWTRDRFLIVEPGQQTTSGSEGVLKVQQPL